MQRLAGTCLLLLAVRPHKVSQSTQHYTNCIGYEHNPTIYDLTVIISVWFIAANRLQ